MHNYEKAKRILLGCETIPMLTAHSPSSDALARSRGHRGFLSPKVTEQRASEDAGGQGWEANANGFLASRGDSTMHG